MGNLKGTVTLAAATVAVLALAGSAAAAKNGRPVQIGAVSGQVEWQKAGGSDWAPATAAQPISSGDRLRTGSDSTASINLEDGGTVEVAANTEFWVQSLTGGKDPASRETILGISKGQLRAQLPSIPEGAVFQIQTPTNNVTLPAAGADPALITTVGPEGAVNVTSEDGLLNLFREGELNFTASLETGEKALLEHDPTAGELKITNVGDSPFDVKGPDGSVYTLNPGDSVVLRVGAATFIPAVAGFGDQLGAGTVGEPQNADDVASSISSSAYP